MHDGLGVIRTGNKRWRLFEFLEAVRPRFRGDMFVTITKDMPEIVPENASPAKVAVLEKVRPNRDKALVLWGARKKTGRRYETVVTLAHNEPDVGKTGFGIELALMREADTALRARFLPIACRFRHRAFHDLVLLRRHRRSIDRVT
jgi:hypothetical protein